MGRKRSKDFDLPPNVYRKGTRLYWRNPANRSQWTPLGDDINEARRRWAELEGEVISDTDKALHVIVRRYEREVFPNLARRTQLDYLKHLRALKIGFGEDTPIDSIRPKDVADYLRVRGEASTVQANRDIAVFSTLFNHARQWGYTDADNPARGVRKHRERPRERYVTDVEYKAVYEAAGQALRDAMDVALLTGQRPADVLKMQRTDVLDGVLSVRQNKTGKKLRIELIGELGAVIDRILSRPRKLVTSALIQDVDGSPLTANAMRSRFDKARKKAGVQFQFRDLRAKAATDTEDLAHAQDLLGHASRNQTEDYTRERLGKKVKPLR